MVNFETPLTKQELKLRANNHWDGWRLVLDAGMNYDTVFHQMSPMEIAEANTAYDLLLQAREKAAKKAAKGR